MRKDLKDLIINIGRYRDSWCQRKATPRKGSEDYWEVDWAPSKKKGKLPADRLQPLKKYLRKNVGRPFNKIWAEVCEVADNRSIRGFHLRQHLAWLVDNCGIEKESPSWLKFVTNYYHNRFYVDDKGILRANGEYSR